MPKRARNTLIGLACLLLIGWVNVYICRELFLTECTRHMNTMHGFWIAIARLATTHWYKPTWWPFWDAGMPFEFTYAPLVPALTAFLAKITGWTVSHAFNAVSGFFYSLIPLTLFIMAWRITRAPGWSLAAALVYSLLSPTALILPDGNFQLSALWYLRRLYLNIFWDETPHLAALSLLPLVVLFLSRSLERRKPVYYALAGLFISLASLANVFGAAMSVIIALCLVLAMDRHAIARNLLLVSLIGAAAYLFISPFLPPSLIGAIQRDAHLSPEDRWALSSFTAFSATVLGCTALWSFLLPKIKDWPLRFFVLFAWITSSIPLLSKYGSRHFLPEPDRYKVEMEMALVLLVVFAIRSAVDKLPTAFKAGVAMLLLSLAAEQVVHARHLAKDFIRPGDNSQTIEYRVSQWIEKNLPGERVLLPGSLGLWSNAFSSTRQFSGSSWSTAPNPVQQLALEAICTGLDPQERAGALSTLWLKGFGVQALAVPGPNSEEFWKAVANPQRFDGLPVLWREDDVTIYRVPQRSASLAHVVPEGALVRHALRRGNMDTGEIRGYAAALDDPALPLARMEWHGFNEATVNTEAQKGQVISVQVSYHPGWRALVNGRTSEVFRDGLGLLYVRPNSNGPSEVKLTYDGGWESKLCRLLSASVLIAVVLYLWSGAKREVR
jgi:hypothetical protein